jgi:hypothetical protein
MRRLSKERRLLNRSQWPLVIPLLGSDPKSCTGTRWAENLGRLPAV